MTTWDFGEPDGRSAEGFVMKHRNRTIVIVLAIIGVIALWAHYTPDKPNLRHPTQVATPKAATQLGAG